MKTHAILLLFLCVGFARGGLERIRPEGDHFVRAESGRSFTAWGFNYDHKEDGRLLESYWVELWPDVADDFKEMKNLGANVVRVHLQVGAFMKSADTPNQAALAQLARLITLAEETGLYLNLTGLGCYHKQEVPDWYDALPEAERWAVQARFWEAVAKVGRGHPTIFCYDLMNEPILPGKKTETDWLAGEFGGKHFVQRISLDLAGRTREEVARAWIDTLASAIRKHDPDAMITVGVIPWAHTWPKARPLFYAEAVGKALDFVSVHFYPRKGEVEKALDALKVYELGKPLVIEEIFPLKCGADELETFIDRSRDFTDGYIGFYWGKKIEEYTKDDGFAGAFMVSWLNLFKAKTAPPANWPTWRGPLANGLAPDADPPTNWSEEKNIRWKIPLEGEGHSTPILWDDRLFLTAAVPFGEKEKPRPDTAPGAHDFRMLEQHFDFRVMAINRADGSLIWQTSLLKEYPHEAGYITGSQASNSPVTDGYMVYAFFGSRGLYALDFDGNLVWKKDLGRMQTRHAHGEGSSPVLYGNTLVVNWDHEGDSFLVAFNKQTGEELWRTARDEMTSWSTPIVAEVNGAPQVIVSATGKVRGYDLKTGKEIWACGGLSRNVVATPIFHDGVVYVSNSYDWKILMAIDVAGGKGEALWTLDRHTSYVPSPLLYGEHLYVLGHLSGVLTVVDIHSGKVKHGPFRLKGMDRVYGSPVGADERIYISDLDGTTIVLSHENEPRTLAVNQLDDGFSASPVAVGKDLYLRGRRNLYCIANGP